MFPGGVRALFVLLLSVGVCASLPRSARAWTELLSMDVLPEQAGWTLIDDGNPFSSSVVSGGILALNALQYREYRAPASWLATANAAAGYVIEFRMRIDTGSSCWPDREIGIWYYDNTNITILGIDPDRIYVHYPTDGQPWAALNARVWHTYRIVVLGSSHRVFVDGALLLDYNHPGTGDGSHVLQFGDLGGSCGYSLTEWDYFAYNTDMVVATEPVSWGRIKTLYRGEHEAPEPKDK